MEKLTCLIASSKQNCLNGLEIKHRALSDTKISGNWKTRRYSIFVGFDRSSSSLLAFPTGTIHTNVENECTHTKIMVLVDLLRSRCRSSANACTSLKGDKRDQKLISEFWDFKKKLYNNIHIKFRSTMDRTQTRDHSRLDQSFRTETAASLTQNNPMQPSLMSHFSQYGRLFACSIYNSMAKGATRDETFLINNPISKRTPEFGVFLHVYPNFLQNEGQFTRNPFSLTIL